MNDYKDIMNRLKEYYEVSTYIKVAKRLQINYDTIKSWGSRKKVVVETLLDHLKDEPINITWLLTGKGSMKLSENERLLHDLDIIDKALNHPIDEEILGIIRTNKELQSLIKLLPYAPKEFISNVIDRLEQFKKLSKI